MFHLSNDEFFFGPADWLSEEVDYRDSRNSLFDSESARSTNLSRELLDLQVFVLYVEFKESLDTFDILWNKSWKVRKSIRPQMHVLWYIEEITVISGLNCHFIGFAHIGTRLFHIGCGAYIFHLFGGENHFSTMGYVNSATSRRWRLSIIQVWFKNK